MAAMTGLLLLLWAGVAVCSVVDLQKRIIGGNPCGPKERLYHVKLISRKGTLESLCGGSLIGLQWVLTAAHCWEDEPGWKMTAYVGIHPGGDQEILKVLHHYQYHDHDIMLLKIALAKKSHPLVRLPDCKNRPKGNVDKVQIAGFGPTTVDPKTKIKGNDKPRKLQCGEMTVVDCTALRDCVKKNPEMWKTRKDEHWLCYKDKNGKADAGPGDSGGGLVVNNRIYGVHVISVTRACVIAAGSMDVCHKDYLEWIINTTGIKP